jgi:hypothetical protein
VAHAHDPGNGRHRQALAVSRADGLVALLPQFFTGLLQSGFALGVALGKGSKTVSGVRGLAFSSGDAWIV